MTAFSKRLLLVLLGLAVVSLADDKTASVKTITVTGRLPRVPVGEVTLNAGGKEIECRPEGVEHQGNICQAEVPGDTVYARLEIRAYGFKDTWLNLLDLKFDNGNAKVDVGEIRLDPLSMEDIARKEGVLPPLTEPVIELPAPSNKNGNDGLEVVEIFEGPSADRSSRIFDVTVANSSSSQHLLKTWDIKWTYEKGFLFSIGRGEALKPVAKYVLELGIDPDDPSVKERADPVYPSIILPAASKAAPSMVQLRVQLHYVFSGGRKFHPSDDWDIHFSVGIQDERGSEFLLFDNASWRHGRAASKPK